MSNSAGYLLDTFPDLNSRGAFTLYCDDLRHEMSGKTTIVGVYGSELIVAELPAVLPAFFIVTHVWTPRDKPFRKLVFRVLFDADVMSEEEFNFEELSKAMGSDSPNSEGEGGNGVRRSLRRILRLSPFLVEKQGMLRVRIETEDGEMRTSALRLRLPTDEERKKFEPAR